MIAIAQPAPVKDLVKPFLKLAAMAFGAGFIGVMAIAGTGMLAELGQLPGQRETVSATAPAPSPAVVSGPASRDWNFPKAI